MRTFLANLRMGWLSMPVLARVTLEAMMLAAAAEGLDTALQMSGTVTPETPLMVFAVAMLKAALPIARFAVGVAQKRRPALDGLEPRG